MYIATCITMDIAMIIAMNITMRNRQVKDLRLTYRSRSAYFSQVPHPKALHDVLPTSSLTRFKNF